ncbi:MAG TPA: hypothetical protein VIQ31_33415, partial [Phormidium sp.]
MCHSRAIPLWWSLLPKLGSSNVTEQRDAIAQILPLSKDYKVVVICFRLEGNDKVKVNNSTFPHGSLPTDHCPSFRLEGN